MLDAASLEALYPEIRSLFLNEDAKECLATLKEGINQLHSDDTTTNLQAECTDLMRAAHSLKGSAAITQLPTLSRLAHKLEELLHVIQQGQLKPELGCEILSQSVEQIGNFIAAATTEMEGTTNAILEERILLPALIALENFLQKLVQKEEVSPELMKLVNKVVGVEEGVEECTALVSPTPSTLVSLVDTSQLRQSGFSTLKENRSLNLSIPIEKLNRMNNVIDDLFINHERLSLHQEQLHQVDLTLKHRYSQFASIGIQVRNFYEQLLIQISERDSATHISKVQENFPHPDQLYAALQNLQELAVQIQEATADVGLLSYEFQETLAQSRQQLQGLRKDLIDSRLVRFEFLNWEILAMQQELSRKCNKPVKLEIQGKETLIDRFILEQLRIPLLHLLRNAFDHGIEFPHEREKQGKTPIAQITVASAIQGNQVVVTLTDDGRGINLSHVYQRAVEQGFCDQEIELTKEQILKFLFQPGFSTAATVTTMSGRGLGLDIVQQQVRRLRGSIRVDTKLGQGTEFTICIPLALNILSLLLCRCHQQILAIPATKVKEVVFISEFPAPLLHNSLITWRDRPARMYSLRYLLPYSRVTASFPFNSLDSCLGIVLEIDGEVVVLAVDSILGERELVVKSLDPIVEIPTYILGCAVLGTDEVALVLSPDGLGELFAQINTNLATQDSEREQADTQQSTKILIVDDAIAFRRILEHLLVKEGYEVVQCQDGKEALKQIKQFGAQFNIVISDIEMPQMDGLTLLKEIRSLPHCQRLPVIMLTSRENQLHRRMAEDLGATGYFTKPFQQKEFLHAIASFVTKNAI